MLSDLGFAAYVSYLHMEVTYTNPVMLGLLIRINNEIQLLFFLFYSFLLFIL